MKNDVYYEMNMNNETVNVNFIIHFIFSGVFNLSCLNMIPKFKTVFRVKYFIIKWYFVEESFVGQFCLWRLFYLVHLLILVHVCSILLHMNEKQNERMDINCWIN